MPNEHVPEDLVLAPEPSDLPDPLDVAAPGGSPAAQAQAAMAVGGDPTPTSDTLDSGFGWPTTRQAWLDVAERAGHNAWESVSPQVLGMFGVGGISIAFSWHSWLGILIIAASAALTSVAKNIVAWKIVKVSPKPWSVDTLIGVATAFAGALAGYLVADPLFNVVSFDWPTTLRLCGGAALVALVKMTAWPAVKNGIALANVRATAAGPPPAKITAGGPQHLAP